MTGRRRTKRSLVRSENFANEVESLMTLARERGQASRHNRTGSDALPDGSHAEETHEFLTDRLRSILEDEVLPVYPEGEAFVDSEFHREVVKKALIGLRLETLREVAKARDVDARGNAEDVAEQIARLYRYDKAAIAQLILDNEEEPNAARAFETRIFTITRPVNVDGAQAKLDDVRERLVRTGVARWLAVDSLDRDGDRLSLEGRLRTYSAFVDELGDEPTLSSAPTEKDIVLVLTDGVPEILTEEAGVHVARTAVRAIAAVLEVPLTSGLPIGRSRSGNLAAFDDRTVLLLDVVYNRLAAIGVGAVNLTVARFMTEKGDAETQVAPDLADKHSLKAVRFEGDHLLDSPQACQLIALQGRGLVSLSLWLSAPMLVANVKDAEPPWFPVRLSAEGDHVAVLTGFGRHQPELAGVVHRQIVDQVQKAVEEGVADAAALEALAETIFETARSGKPGSGTMRRRVKR